MSGDNGNDSLTGGTDVLGDTLSGGANNDSIDGNAGADQINVGTGTDRLFMGDADTIVGVVANGTVLTGADVITGIGVGDSISVAGATNGPTNGAAAAVGVAYRGGAAGGTFRLVTGTYNAAANTFTAGAAATDVDYSSGFLRCRCYRCQHNRP